MARFGGGQGPPGSCGAPVHRLDRDAAGEGSHRRLERTGWEPYTYAFHDRQEIGPVMLAKIAKRTALRPEDL